MDELVLVSVFQISGAKRFILLEVKFLIDIIVNVYQSKRVDVLIKNIFGSGLEITKYQAYSGPKLLVTLMVS